MAENEIPISFKWYLNRQGIQGQQGERGEEGFSPTITVNENTLTAYTLKVQNKTGSFVTPNLRQVVSDSGGTYIRYDRTSGNLYAGNADFATTEQAGIVRFCTEEELNSAYDGSVVSPADLIDYLTNTYQLPIATTAKVGAVKPDGTTITIDADGTLHGATTYTLPVADSDTLGGVKIGSGVNIGVDGTISVIPYSLPTASTTVLGGVKVDGSTITIDENGVIKSAGGSSLTNIQDITNGVAIGDVSTPIPSTGEYVKNTIQLTVEPNSNSWNGFNLTVNNDWYENGILAGTSTRKILTENNGIAFVKLTAQEYTDLPNKKSTTMYITTDTNKVYLGTIELTGGGGSLTPGMYAGIPAGGQNTGYVGINTVTTYDPQT